MILLQASAESFTKTLSFPFHPLGDEIIDLSVGLLDRLRWDANDRLRRWIHQHWFRVTNLALIRRGLRVVDGRTVENDFSSKSRGFVCEIGIDLFTGSTLNDPANVYRVRSLCRPSLKT